MSIEREQIEFDVLFVGGGPASLAGAIKLQQLALSNNLSLEIAVLEKGAEFGSHALSGAVLNPIALKELLPDYLKRNFPLETTVQKEALLYLTPHREFKVPIIPGTMKNHGFHIVSQAKLVKWLAGIAEELGVNMFPGFTGKEVLYNDAQNAVIGVRTGDQGLDKDKNPKANFEPGIDILAKVTVFGEGARGSLTKQLDQKIHVFTGIHPQPFELGIKEVIQLPNDNAFEKLGYDDIHFLGYPSGLDIPSGGFIYKMKEHRIAIGYLVGLGYTDPTFDPYDAFIQFKQHPFVKKQLSGGTVIEQGARTVLVGGIHSLTQLAINGAILIGATAGFHHALAIKGIHTSMKSGMLAAEACLLALQKNDFTEQTLSSIFTDRLTHSWVKKELDLGRNYAPAMAKPGIFKFMHLGSQYLSYGRGFKDPMKAHADHTTLKPKTDVTEPKSTKIEYDGTLFVDKLTGVYLSKTMHREDQPSHIIIHDPRICMDDCYPIFGAPCLHFCPGNVYELIEDEETKQKRIQLNPSNCLHCKTCDIKDPYENITWTCPEGGEGPGYIQA